MKASKRQVRRLPLPDGPTITLRLDTGQEIVMDRIDKPGIQVPEGTPHCAYMGFGFLVIVTRSIHPEHGQLLHASISHASGQLPPWYVVKALKQAVFPDNVAAMIPLPEAESYTNVAEALHIIQTPGAWGHL